MISRIQQIAEDGLILKVLVGSGVHGTAIEGSDDTDHMGICFEPPECVIGLERFEQYEHRTAWERGRNARSQAGDLDLVVYGLRKWLRLALAGNPTILLPMFTPSEHVIYEDRFGKALRDEVPEMVASREAGRRFLGYMQAQRAKMLGLRSTHTNRPELIEAYGYDCKFAMHMVRLGLQGVEYLRTGRITLPVPQPDRDRLRLIRMGQVTKDEIIVWAEELEAELSGLLLTSPLPDRPDTARANAWLVSMYMAAWSDSDE